MTASIRVSELAHPLQDGVFLDVREPDEWVAGHIEGALHITLATVPLMTDDLPLDVTIYVICKSGARSAQAARWLTTMGWEAINVTGGMMAWESAALPMVSETSDPAYVV